MVVPVIDGVLGDDVADGDEHQHEDDHGGDDDGDGDGDEAAAEIGAAFIELVAAVEGGHGHVDAATGRPDCDEQTDGPEPLGRLPEDRAGCFPRGVQAEFAGSQA